MKDTVKQKFLLILLGAALILLALSFGLYFLFLNNPQLAEFYAQHIYPILAGIGIILWGWLPFSLAEVLVLAGIIVLFISFFIWLWRLLKRKEERGKRLIRLFMVIVISLSLLASNFILLYSLNFSRQPLSYSFDLEVKPRSIEELVSLTNWLATEAALVRADLLEDEDGVMLLKDGKRAVLKDSYLGYELLAEKYPLLKKGLKFNPKGVFLSRYWSYTGIVGMFMPLTAEANVNIDQPDFNLPFTALHEIAHVKGFAREDEANFLAFLTALEHPNPEFRYSALLISWIYASNQLVDRETSRSCQLCAISPAMRRDLDAQSRYWDQFRGWMEKTSTKINDTVLKANRQEDGVESYGRMIDLTLAWFEKEQAVLDE